LTIAIVTISFPALSETFISNKVIHLAKRGHDVIVFCNSINNTLFTKIFSGVSNVKVIAFSRPRILRYITLHPSALLTGKRGTELTGSIINKVRLYYISKHKPDVVHIEFSGLGILYLPVLKKLGSIKVVSCRGSAEKVMLLTSQERKKNTTALFDHVNAVHCVSGDMKETILPYCTDASKIFINFPSVDPEIFKRRLPFKHRPVNILSIGRFTFQKGYLTGLLAMKKLKESFTDFKWTIIGDGPQKEEIIFHIHNLGLTNHVHLAGAKGRAEILEAYNSASLFFLPSVYEGIANVVLEAMSMELPVVATKSGGMSEVIKHGYNGMLADIYDCNAMAVNMLVLSNDGEKSLQMGIAARQRILQQFTIDKQADIFEMEYKKLLNTGA